MFDAILCLQKRLPSSQQLEIMHSGHGWNASFRWAKPAEPDLVQDVITSFHDMLPKDYIAFLEQVSNGAVLYYDTEFGQWGFELYGTDKLISKQIQWEQSIPAKWSSRFIAFGELFGDANAMVFDLSKPLISRVSYAVLEANAIDPTENWQIASRSFHEWLDHLITAQGDKYWQWM